jgi:hypothetical protein
MPRRQGKLASRADNVPPARVATITDRHGRRPAVIRLNERVRHNGAGEDEPTGPLPGGDDWPLPPDGSVLPDDLGAGELWESEGPGSTAAAARGCLCPMLPNDPRAGLGVLIAPDCPVHRSQLE